MSSSTETAGARAAAALLAAALALAAAACGGGGTHGAAARRRTAVAQYIVRVDLLEQHAARTLNDVQTAYRSFSLTPAELRALRPRLARGTASLTRLRARIAALRAPADARALRARILGLVDAEVRLARETEGISTFLPSFDRTLAQLSAPGARLNHDLAAARQRGAQAAAFERYAAALAAPAARLSKLAPPSVLRPLWRTQLTTLRRLRAAATGLAAALRRGDAPGVVAAEKSFTAAAAARDAIGAQKAEIAAIEAYDARVAALRRQARAIALERSHLQKRLA